MRKFFTVVIIGLLSAAAFAGEITFNLPAFDGERVTKEGVTSFRGWSSYETPGSPAMPYKDVFVFLPFDAAGESLSVKGGGEIYASGVTVRPTPPMAKEGYKEPKITKTASVYNSDNPYPASPAKLLGVREEGAVKYAVVRCYPLTYYPKSGVIKAAKDASVTVSYMSNGETARKISRTGETYELVADRLAEKAVNFNDFEKWYVSREAKAAEAAAAKAPGYMIITTDAIYNACKESIDNFIWAKETMGYSVYLRTDSDWGGGYGATAATNIRNYVYSNRSLLNIKYMLMIGNPIPETGDVPMARFYTRRKDDAGDTGAPTDYYYADPVTNFDRDGDGYMGVYGVDIRSTYSFSTKPAIYVGRIACYGSTATDYNYVKTALDTTVKYQLGMMRKPRLKKLLFSFCPLDADTTAYELAEQIIDAVRDTDYTWTRIYKTDGGFSPEKMPVSISTVTNEWANGYGFHLWSSHGWTKGATDIIDTAHVPSLSKTCPTIVFTTSCKNGAITDSDNIAFTLLRTGAAASVVAASTDSWYYVGEDDYTESPSNGGMAYAYSVSMLKNQRNSGDSLFKYAEPDDPGSSAMWTNFVCFNIFGDPSLKIYNNEYICGVLAADHDAIKKFSTSTKIVGWTKKTNWNKSTEYVKDWYGVTVEKNRVVGISLPGNNVKGDVPEEIGDLTALTTLNLSDNEITSLPDVFGAFTSLTSVDVSMNRLSALPATLTTLLPLRTLNASGNMLTSVPGRVANVTADFNYNQISRSILTGRGLQSQIPTQTLYPSGARAYASDSNITVTWPLEGPETGYYELIAYVDGVEQVIATVDKPGCSVSVDTALPTGVKFALRQVVPPHEFNKNNLEAKSGYFYGHTAREIPAENANPKSITDGLVVRITGANVSARFGDCYYVQSPFNIWGIKVIGTPREDGVVLGCIRTGDDGERYIEQLY
ncbi:MAG: leucine-rich repeat domain-containing protein [Abditibacteriota bacterium]|nr:leucine-rich repeat domain-containing protein [Abditibacteriota bacterium]